MPADTWHLGDWPTARWIPVAPEEMEDAASLHVGLIQDDRMLIIHQGDGSAVLFPVEILGALQTAIDLLLAPGETVDAKTAPRRLRTEHGIALDRTGLTPHALWDEWRANDGFLWVIRFTFEPLEETR